MYGNDRGWQSLRARIWLARVIALSGLSSLKAIERVLRKEDRMDDHPSGNLLRYLDPRGKLPFRTRTGDPRLFDTIWPKRAEAKWPGALEWLSTPFWYLWEHDADREAVLTCIRLLPEDLQELLVVVIQTPAGERWDLEYVCEPLVYELTRSPSAASLGAVACAMARARLAGDLAEEKRCVDATIWMLSELHAGAHAPVRHDLETLLHWITFKAQERIYVGGMQAPVTLASLQRFFEGRKSELAWTVEGALARWNAATWPLQRPGPQRRRSSQSSGRSVG